MTKFHIMDISAEAVSKTEADPIVPSTPKSNTELPYIIYRRTPGAGFWSNFSCVLQGLDDADLRGLPPVVDMERHTTFYNEKEPIHGTRNAWEYYFEQPSGIGVAQAAVKGATDNGGRSPGRFVGIQATIPPPETLKRGRFLVGRYIRVREDVNALADAILPRGVNPKVLGVHIRGTDLRQGTYPGHHIPDVREAYLERAIDLDNQHNFTSIFLATDEIENIELFRTHFGERLLTTDAHRTSQKTVTAHNMAWLLDVPRRHHKYLLGREVLIDVLLLARCGHFICGVSNVASATAYFSADSQCVHPIPSLWITPRRDGRSQGQNNMKACRAPDGSSTAEARERELYRLLENAENTGYAIRRDATKMRRILSAIGVLAVILGIFVGIYFRR